MAPINIKTVAIIGASGNLGSYILKSLLTEAPHFKVTIITRSASSATFPTGPNITVQKGDYESSEFLQSALAGTDVLINVLSNAAPPSLSDTLYDAASAAGVKWVIPKTFGTDYDNPKLTDQVPFLAGLVALKKEILDRGLGYTGFKPNPLFDLVLKMEYFQVDIKSRKATLFVGGSNTKFNTTTLPQIGLAVARLLKLHADPASPLTLEEYAGTDLYVSSFRVSQEDILASVQRVTGTSDDDWTIDREKTLAQYVGEGKEALGRGEFSGLFPVLFGTLFEQGTGGDYEGDGKPLSNDLLGLPVEDLDEVVKRVVDDIEAGK